MSTAHDTAGPTDPMEAGWIDSPQGKLFACYHPPQGGARRTCGVLFCDPFGADRMNLHLSYRQLAIRLASEGFPTLRVDYPGTCDSSGDPRDPDLFEAWLASLHTAAEWLKRRAGVEQLSVFGALLGGTLATVFSTQREDVTGLVLWGALPDGHTFLREAVAMRRLMRSNPDGLLPSSWREGDREVLGFIIPKQMAEAIARVDLSKLKGRMPHAAAVLPRGRSAPITAIVQTLQSGGADVYVQQSPAVEIAALVDRDAHPPTALIDEMLEWWRATYPESRAPLPSSSPNLETGLESSSVLAAPSGARVRETVVHFGSDHGIFGIVSEPLERRASGPALVLVNGGTNHRPGINRNYTEWARAWAARGRVVLRFDIRGLGDSPPLYPRDLCVLYRPESRTDICDAFDFLATRYGKQRFICLGLCGGAYQSLHTALEDSRVCGVVMLNPLRFQAERSSLPDFQSEFDHKPLARQVRAALSPKKWRSALRGELDLRRKSRLLLGQLRSDADTRTRQLRSWLRGEDRPPSSWMAAVFLELLGRRCNLLIVLNADDAMVSVMNEQLEADLGRLKATGRFAIELIDNTDHIFSPLWSQERLSAILEATLTRWYAETNGEAPLSPP